MFENILFCELIKLPFICAEKTLEKSFSIDRFIGEFIGENYREYKTVDWNPMLITLKNIYGWISKIENNSLSNFQMFSDLDKRVKICET